MGNSAPGASRATRTLELRIFAPRIQLLYGRSIFAKVGVLEDRDAAIEVGWEEPVQVQLDADRSLVLVSLFSSESWQRHETLAEGETRLLWEVCLPFYGPGGLLELGVMEGSPPVMLELALTQGKRCVSRNRDELAEDLQQAREQFHPDRPYLALSVQEIQVREDGSDLQMPSALQQIIALELHNAALQEKKRELLRAHPDPMSQMLDVSTEEPVATHERQLTQFQHENEQLRADKAEMLQKLERANQILSGDHDAASQFQFLKQELSHSRERQADIRAKFHERKQELQLQLQQQQAATHASQQSAVASEARVEQARAWRDELRGRWRLAEEQRRRRAAVELSTSPDVQRLVHEGEHYKNVLSQLRQELAQQQEQDVDSARQDELRRSMRKLYDDLQELDQIGEDERVRSESEMRELRNERDAVREHLGQAAAELQQLRAKAEALRGLRAQAVGTLPDCEIEEIDAGTEQLERELDELRYIEDARKMDIQELERAQEDLVRKTSMVTGAGGPGDRAGGLEEKVGEVTELLRKGAASCSKLEGEVAVLRRHGEEARMKSSRLKQSYDAMQRSSDERVLRSPGTSTDGLG